MSSSIGQQLSDARLRCGLVLEDVQHKTRIPVVRLAEMENDDFSGFANAAYAKCFLLLYTRFLKLDLGDHLRAFPCDGANGSILSTHLQPQSDPLAGAVLKTRDESAPPFRLAWVALTVAGLIGVVVWYGTRHGRQQTGAAREPEKVTLAQPSPIMAAHSLASQFAQPGIVTSRGEADEARSRPVADHPLSGSWDAPAMSLPVVRADPAESAKPGTSSPNAAAEVRRAIDSPRAPSAAAHAASGNR
jgi:cytoskeletal protein RodZ